MTQETFKAWWYNEGSQAPYTHHDCEEHTMRMCEIAWANGAYKALAEHAMQEVQRLGQEIEQERTWVGLTDEERYLNDGRTEEEIEYARAIEAKLKEKNT